MITESQWVDLEFINKDIVMKAKEMYIKYDDKELSFTDWISYVQIDKNCYDGIISFDREFDKVGLNRKH